MRRIDWTSLIFIISMLTKSLIFVLILGNTPHIIVNYTSLNINTIFSISLWVDILLIKMFIFKRLNRRNYE